MMKKVGSCYYVHKSNREELYETFKGTESYPFLVVTIENVLSMSHNAFAILKYDKKKNTVSFIQCPDWDRENEPVVGDSIIFDLATADYKIVKARKNNPQIYHHKWMFVADDYKGFDVEASKRRTKLLYSVPSFHYKEVKSRIGNQDYWIAWCITNGIRL